MFYLSILLFYCCLKTNIAETFMSARQPSTRFSHSENVFFGVFLEKSHFARATWSFYKDMFKELFLWHKMTANDFFFFLIFSYCWIIFGIVIRVSDIVNAISWLTGFIKSLESLSFQVLATRLQLYCEKLVIGYLAICLKDLTNLNLCVHALCNHTLTEGVNQHWKHCVL